MLQKCTIKNLLWSMTLQFIFFLLPLVHCKLATESSLCLFTPGLGLTVQPPRGAMCLCDTGEYLAMPYQKQSLATELTFYFLTFSLTPWVYWVHDLHPQLPQATVLLVVSPLFNLDCHYSRSDKVSLTHSWSTKSVSQLEDLLSPAVSPFHFWLPFLYKSTSAW